MLTLLLPSPALMVAWLRAVMTSSPEPVVMVTLSRMSNGLPRPIDDAAWRSALICACSCCTTGCSALARANSSLARSEISILIAVFEADTGKPWMSPLPCCCADASAV
ncbi:MAG: hypothetical protein EWM45_11380 [Rhodopseudomonas palustris]|nr:MAG: hypothetical protein EWM45_11380 [Rhodopseudomonas palustris]